MGALGRRVLVAAIGIPLVVAVVYVGGIVLAGLLSLCAAIGAWEFHRLAGHRAADPLATIGILLSAAVPLLVHLAFRGYLSSPLAAAGALFVALLAVLLWSRDPSSRPIEGIAITTFAVLYCGATLSFAYALRHHRFVVEPAAGLALVLYPVVLTWISDTGAYAFGRWLGKRRLMPSVSPGKTVAGTVGGIGLTVAGAWLYNDVVLRPVAELALAPWTALVFGAVVSGVGQVGDLVESLFKRQAGVKDSSSILSAHGGVLDRLDSLYLVIPAAYLILSRLLLAAPR
jgi:phosphatidate cytidylyltransferase